MPFIASGDCRLNVLVEGPQDGVPVILSHHIGGDIACFDVQMPVLAGRRVVRFDTRGQGASEAPEGDYSVALLGSDVLAIMDALGIARADFVGVSQGGMTGMWLAAHHPERIRRLVLANTTPFIPNKQGWDDLAARARAEGMADIARTTIESWLSEGFRAGRKDAVERLVAAMAGMPVAGYAGNASALRDVDLRDALPSISAPTLVIGGAEDGPRGAALPLITQSVRNGRSVVLPNAAHLSNVENPQAFNAAMIEHLGDGLAADQAPQ
ncbi:beta-ketoadipate enol-lactone hydrolase [Sphingobium sp. SYK-6]|uniref:alpha/beta fold hydrolase n=1 Tax=Sphingobium sp. (strain NBRC 103272 / SYK-6) TaxID=627192 RepID=UPI0002277016|nr:alpha/beta fold hydrolase [Sphingobium sp. SYK-6]BAK67402.1 beta-ketoadipate enol-lactone hydrolase [Sphingobium sp. SYK-6]